MNLNTSQFCNELSSFAGNMWTRLNVEYKKHKEHNHNKEINFWVFVVPFEMLMMMIYQVKLIYLELG